MFQESSLNLLIHSLPMLFKSAVSTIQIALAAMGIGCCFGLLLGIANCRKLNFKYLGIGIDAFVWAVRGTPLFVQVLIFYYALPEILGISLSPFIAGVCALGINSTAYISEIVRAGINAIPDGQWEAAHVLGYNRRQTLQSIVIPQMFRDVLPSLTNELTALVKETSILMVIGVAELTKMSKDIVARELDPMTIYLASAAIYLALTSGISIITQVFQRRLSS